MQVLKQELGIDNLSSPGWTFPQGPFLKNEKKIVIFAIQFVQNLYNTMQFPQKYVQHILF